MYSGGNLEAALAQGITLATAFPNNATIPNILGAIYSGLGKLQEAIDSFTQVIKLKPNHADGYYNLGKVIKGSGTHEEAIDNYKKALTIKPSFSEVYYNLGNILKDNRYYKQAIVNYKKTIAITPDYSSAYNNLGIAFNHRGEFKQSVVSFWRAIELKPNLLKAWTNIYCPMKVLNAIDGENRDDLLFFSKVPSSSLVEREVALLKYRLNKGSSRMEYAFGKVNEFIGSTPNLYLKNPNLSSDVTRVVKDFPDKTFALQHFGRSGTGLFHSLMDNHSEVSTLPSIYFSEFFDHSIWDKITIDGWNGLVDRFIAMYPVFFDARASAPVLTQGRKELSHVGVKEGMASVGENKDEFLYVNKESFRKSLSMQLSHHSQMDSFTFFKLVHIAYEEVLFNENKKTCILYHIHNPDIYAKINFIHHAPAARWVVMVREPLQSCESWIRGVFKNNDYMGLSNRIHSMLFEIDDIVYQKHDSIGIRLEDLIEAPRKMIPALCEWMGIKEESSLYEMTAQGKKWWGDPTSPDFGKEGQSLFDRAAIDRKVGSIFSEKDQFILKTLFYPFLVRFNYIEPNLSEFKNNLREIRPMIDQLFDFEQKIVNRQQIAATDFIKSGYYLHLRSGMIERWNTLNKYNTYPNMLKPLVIKKA